MKIVSIKYLVVFRASSEFFDNPNYVNYLLSGNAASQFLVNRQDRQ